MKRILLISLLLFLALSISFGQIAYKKGDQVASVSLGLGSVYALSGTTGGTPPLVATYDYGYNENISLGGLFGYTSSSWSAAYGGYSETSTISDIVIGVRGAYHYDVLHNDKIDTYGGVMLAYDIESASTTSNLPAIYQAYAGSVATASALKIGFFLGGRYYFSPNWAGQVELGYDIAYLKIGIGYKF